MLKFYVGDAFIVKIIRARPYGSGFYGLRYATEHPADGSPSGPANPSRVFHKIVMFYLGLPAFRSPSFGLHRFGFLTCG